MDDYQEYSRMAKMMTNIYAMPKESQDENDSSNTYLAEGHQDKKPEEEAKTTKQTISFKFQNGSNLDASMEEEKAPLQNFWLNSGFQSNASLHKPAFLGSKFDKFGEQNNEPHKSGDEIMDDDTCPQDNQNLSQVNGASLFGGKNIAAKKAKPKKKKMKRI